MPFNVALSGLRAASTDLEVTGNNVANASTTGFKKSSVQFGDLYGNTFYSGNVNQIGDGVRVQSVSQHFGQGNISITDNNLDLAINGEGFFVLDAGGERRYSRAGHFGINNQGYIVNNTGMYIQGYTANNGVIGGALGPIHVSSENLAPRRTESVTANLNLNSGARVLSQPVSELRPGETRTLRVVDANGVARTINITVGNDQNDLQNQINNAMAQEFGAGAPTMQVGVVLDANGDLDHFTLAADPATPATVAEHTFDPTDPSTYNHTTSTMIYDSLGNAHVMSMYFVKEQGVADSELSPWVMYLQIDGQNVGAGSYNMVFNSDGSLNRNLSDQIQVNNWTPLDASGYPNGATANAPFTVDMSSMTQYGSAFAVNDMQQDGYTTGRLSGVDVGDDGVIFARYTNGQSRVIAQVALASFKDMNGLASLGDTTWAETHLSGQPLIGAPGTAALGRIQASALEDSNVDLSDQLVNLIVAQRNYQANAKTIETANAVTQTIINLR